MPKPNARIFYRCGINKVSKLMGQAQIKETQIYAKIVNEELDKAMDVFNS
jgi:site-specific recombinase XerD